MIGIAQQLVSSKKANKTSRPSSAPSEPSQPPEPPPQVTSNTSTSNSELLQLRLENSDLRRRLETLTNTDESKLELLQLLEEQTSQTNHLQSKCDELAVGFVEIDKERRLLRKSADDARKDAMHEVEQTRAECDKRCGKLERHIKMKEKEVDTLAERIREQERRIEAVMSESNGRQAKVEALEGELDELIGMVQSEREERKKMIDEHEKSIESLKQRIQDLQQTMQSEEEKNRLREEMITKDLQGKEADVTKLLQDQKLSKIEHEQALRSFQDNLEALQNEKSDIINNLKSEMNQLEANYQQSHDTTSQLQNDLNNLQLSHQMAREELKAKIFLLEKENRELADKATQLVDTKEMLGNLQAKHTTLQTEYALLGKDHSERKDHLSTLEGQMERMTANLNEEKNTSNKLRSQLRELNIQLKEDGSARQNEKHALERELEGANKIILTMQEEANNLRARFEAEASGYRTDMESLRTEHAAQIMIIETSGANVVSDLEDAIGVLRKELADNTLKHEEVIIELKLEKESVECDLSDREKVITELQSKIENLTTYAKERKEEVKLAKSDLTRVSKEREDAVSVIRDELQNAQVSHEKEKDALRSELAAVKEQLSAEDGELERVKATLSERTNLLRSMVNQTKSYQGDYEREHARADALEETVASYKKQLADARNAGQRLEQEIHDKDTQYCDAIRIERHQRRAMEVELESLHKSMEAVLRKNAEVEKNAEMLKDKVSRQENYIVRLQDREKQNRRTSTMSTKTSRLARPSTAGVRPTQPPIRAKESRANNHLSNRSASCNADENDTPNIG